MELHLRDKIAVVTGGSRGIGLAVVEALAHEGAKVVVGSRTMSDELSALIREYPLRHLTVDLSTVQGPDALIKYAMSEFGGVDILINNVGDVHPRKGFLQVTDDDWQETFAINFYSLLRTTRAVLPSMLDRKSGAIINIGTTNAHVPVVGNIDYCIAKGAVIALTKVLSEEFAPQGIRVNAVSPGPTLTSKWTAEGGLIDIFSQRMGTRREDYMGEKVKLLKDRGVSLERWGTPHEIANLVIYLASDAAAFTTGAVYMIDGGLMKAL